MISALPVSGAAVPNTIGAQLDVPRISLISASFSCPKPLPPSSGPRCAAHRPCGPAPRPASARTSGRGLVVERVERRGCGKTRSSGSICSRTNCRIHSSFVSNSGSVSKSHAIASPPVALDYCPTNRGARFSANAVAPSRASLLAEHRADLARPRPAGVATLRRGRRTSRLTVRTASGPFAAIRFGQRERLVDLLPGRHHPVDQAELERTRRVERLAGERDLERDRPAGSAWRAACRRHRASDPRFTSANPNITCSAATARSHAIMISKPPPTVAPLSAATIGFG